MFDLGGAKRARTADLLHAMGNSLGSLVCDEPSGVSGFGRHGFGRDLQRSKARADLQDAGPGESASANGRSHGHPAGMLFRLGPSRWLPRGGVQADGQTTVR